MKQYYYAVTALPYLQPDATPPMSSNELLAFLKSQLDEPDFRIVERCSLAIDDGAVQDTHVLRLWNAWEKNLRNELVQLRAKHKKSDGDRFVKPCDAFVTDALRTAAAAFVQDDPAAAEDIMLKARWAFLDDHESQHHFDIEKIIIYRIKLLLLERKAAFNTKSGADRLDGIMSRFEETLRSKRDTLWKK